MAVQHGVPTFTVGLGSEAETGGLSGPGAAILEGAEAAARSSWLGNVPADYAARMGIGVQSIGGATCMHVREVGEPGWAHFLNRVIGLGVTRPATEEVLVEIVAFYGEIGVPFTVALCPAAQPHALPQWLEARGLKRSRSWAKWYRGVEEPPTVGTGLRIARVDAKYAQAYIDIVVSVFALPQELKPSFEPILRHPNFNNYLAFDGDTPVAAASLYVRNGVGSLFNGATLPSHRRRGAQGALLGRRIHDAAALGCRWLVTETGEDTAEEPNPSYHNMLRAGFKLAYLRPNYLS